MYSQIKYFGDQGLYDGSLLYFSPMPRIIARMKYEFDRIPSPSYVVDIHAFEHNLVLIDGIQKEADVRFIPALKGFALWKLFSRLKHFVTGAAASGLYESRLIFEEMGVFAHTYSPAFNPGTFEKILRYSSHITFNSRRHYPAVQPEW